MTVRFGVPQGSILGPMLFNLYVSDLQDHLPSTVSTYQYADDTSLYSSCRPAEIQETAKDLNSTLNTVSSWSAESHLALNPTKTKAMLISTPQMSRVHSLDRNRPNLTISNKTLEYIIISKLLGVNFQENLKWDEHINALCKSCFGTLRILRKIKNFTDFKLRKHLAESLILSKLSYCDTVFYPLPDFLLNRLQRVQYVAASFVLGRYVRCKKEILNLGWLPLSELRDYSILRSTFKALYSNTWPSYLKLQTVKPARNLRSSVATRLMIPLTANTFQHSAAKLFNSLPADLRNCTNFNQFSAKCKHLLKERALSSL